MSDVWVGLELLPFERQTGIHEWNRFAAVNEEFIAIHMDDGAGVAAGLGGAIGMGNLQWAYLHNALRDWPGERGRVLALKCEFRSPNMKGQTISAHGRVTAVRAGNGSRVVDLDVFIKNQEGLILAPGHAVVALGREDSPNVWQSERLGTTQLRMTNSVPLYA
jgi:acyl dehydratase